MGPRGHEASHHAAILELVPDGICVVWVGLLEKPLEVVHRRPRLMLVTVCGSCGASHAGAAHLAIIIIGRGHGPLKALPAPLFATFDALLGDVGGDVGRHLPITAWGRLLASLGRAKHDCLIASGALGGDVVQLLKHIPQGVTMSALPRALYMALRVYARATLASLGLIALTLLP
jgi:hypothetical protein